MPQKSPFSSMGEVQEEMLPPFWLQSSQADHRLRRSYSLFLSSGTLLIFILATAIVFISIIVPTLVSFTSHIFKPHLVKKSWDSLNLVLVLFAIVCGFLSRNSNESPRSYEDENLSNAPRDYVSTETPRRWYVSADCTPYRSFNRLRSINSYPDLCQESSWLSGEERWRFYDDTHVNGYHGLDRLLRPEADEEEMAIKIKNIAIDTFIASTEEIPTSPPQLGRPPSPPQPLSSSPPMQPTKAVRRRTKRTYQAIGQAEKSEKQENNDLEIENFRQSPSKLPPPPLPQVFPPVQESNGKNEKKRGSAAKDFLTTLRRRKKKQRQKSMESFETILNSEVTHLPSKPPPLAPPPPPQPPQPRISSMRVLKTKPHIGGVISHKPHIPNKRETSKLEEKVIANNESQLNLIPPPPPPPPAFKVPVWKFRVQGDYVRVDSISSSCSSSPDLDEVGDLFSNQTSPLNSPSTPNGGESTMPLFCPSPDVDTKADTFIARFRAGLRLEKMNSMKEKQGIGKSNLGPSPPETKEETAVLS